VLRSFFGMPIMGYIDVIEQGTAVFAFLGLAYTQAQGGHIRMELLLQALPRRGLWPVELFNALFALVVTLLLLPGSWLHFERAWRIGDSTMSIGMPTWPSKLLVFLALCMLALRLAVQVWGNLRMTLDPDAEPIAVTPPTNVAEVAADEVELSEGDPKQ
jgi:TRAP-type C4-dicarboxylate transport system permease small subunit